LAIERSEPHPGSETAPGVASCDLTFHAPQQQLLEQPKNKKSTENEKPHLGSKTQPGVPSCDLTFHAHDQQWLLEQHNNKNATDNEKPHLGSETPPVEFCFCLEIILAGPFFPAFDALSRTRGGTDETHTRCIAKGCLRMTHCLGRCNDIGMISRGWLNKSSFFRHFTPCAV